MTESTAGLAAKSGTRVAGVLAPARLMVSPATWLALLHLFAGLLIGLVTFAVVVTGLVAGTGLLPIFGLGILIFMSVIWFSGQLARAERARYELLLAERITPPPAGDPGQGWTRIRRAASRPAVWKQLTYALVRLPFSAAQAAVLIASWSGGLALLALPAYNTALPGGAAHLGQVRLAGAWAVALAAVTGLALLLSAPMLTRALAIADAAAGRLLLGTARRDEGTAR
ncbi:MAG TPA: sensor domain-containing protein [Streptosporangiaceae bacterium]|nr:sensor domain-containing protein [Streptosporangiaceae bacterium]